MLVVERILPRRLRTAAIPLKFPPPEAIPGRAPLRIEPCGAGHARTNPGWFNPGARSHPGPGVPEHREKLFVRG